MAIQPLTNLMTVIPTTRTQVAQVKGAQSTSDAAQADQTASADTTKQDKTAEPSADQLDRVMAEVSKAISPVARNLQFSIDKETGRSVVKVVDSTTNQVIRQIPSEELLAIARSIDKFSGLLVKQKA